MWKKTLKLGEIARLTLTQIYIPLTLCQSTSIHPFFTGYLFSKYQITRSSFFYITLHCLFAWRLGLFMYILSGSRSVCNVQIDAEEWAWSRES